MNIDTPDLREQDTRQELLRRMLLDAAREAAVEAWLLRHPSIPDFEEIEETRRACEASPEFSTFSNAAIDLAGDLDEQIQLLACGAVR